MSRSSLLRTAAWIAIAGLFSVALAAPGPAPAMAGGNPPSSECGELGLYFKIDDIASSGIEPGVYTAATPRVETNWDGQRVTISNVTAGGQAFDWASELKVAKVAWKESTSIFSSTDGLPGNTGSVSDRTEHGISHVIFCGRAPDPTTAPTATPTTAPTATPTASPTGTIEAVTATPGHTPRRNTPPPTDARVVGTSSPSWPLVLAVIASILSATLLVTTPRPRRR